jgi:hypothetical protein
VVLPIVAIELLVPVIHQAVGHDGMPVVTTAPPKSRFAPRQLLVPRKADELSGNGIRSEARQSLRQH